MLCRDGVMVRQRFNDIRYAMYRSVSATTLALALALIGLAWPTGTRADESLIDRGVVLRDAALRSEPGTGTTLAQLVPGTRVDVHGRQGLWMQVTAPTANAVQRGWVFLPAIRLDGGAAAPAAGSTPAGGGFARLSRSVTGLLGGLRGRESNTAHATLGIRGLAAGEIENAHFDAAALAWVAAASASASEAQLFAQAGGLIARDVPALAAGSVPPR